MNKTPTSNINKYWRISWQIKPKYQLSIASIYPSFKETVGFQFSNELFNSKTS